MSQRCPRSLAGQEVVEGRSLSRSEDGPGRRTWPRPGSPGCCPDRAPDFADPVVESAHVAPEQDVLKQVQQLPGAGHHAAGELSEADDDLLAGQHPKPRDHPHQSKNRQTGGRSRRQLATTGLLHQWEEQARQQARNEHRDDDHRDRRDQVTGQPHGRAHDQEPSGPRGSHLHRPGVTVQRRQLPVRPRVGGSLSVVCCRRHGQILTRSPASTPMRLICHGG